MIFPKALMFPLLALLAAPAFSAPIALPGHSIDSLASHPPLGGLDTRAPVYLGHHYGNGPTTAAKRDIESAYLVARDELDAALEARSFDEFAESPLAKREAAPAPMRLVKRKSLGAKIRDAFKKVGQKIKSGFQKAGKAIKKGFQKVGQGIKKVAQKVKTGFQKAGKAIKKGFQKAGKAIKTGFQKAGKAIKKAAQKVGKFIKTTGAKIAKFGLKIYATATKIASKVVGFIPGVGKAVGRVLDGASRLANFASDKIHVSLGKKLDKGMKVMDTIQHPLKGAAGKALDAILKRDMENELLERDFMDGQELAERDLSEFDARSFDDEELFERDLSELETRSLDDWVEMEARSLDDFGTLEARSIFQKDRT